MSGKELYIIWEQANADVFNSTAAFGRISDQVIRPGDKLYSYRVKNIGAYGSGGGSVDITSCSRCGRSSGKNAYAFGLSVGPTKLAGDNCEQCGVEADALEELISLAN